MRVRNDTAERVATRAPPPDFGIQVPDLDRYTEETVGITRVVIGVNPDEVMEKYRLAQERAADLRRKAAKVEGLLASYKARHWTAGTSPSHYDQERKALLHRIIQDEKRARGGKGALNDLDSWAHAQKDYTDFIRAGREERHKMEMLAADLSAINKEIESALGAVAYFDKAARMVEEMIRLSRKTI